MYYIARIVAQPAMGYLSGNLPYGTSEPEPFPLALKNTVLNHLCCIQYYCVSLIIILFCLLYRSLTLLHCVLISVYWALFRLSRLPSERKSHVSPNRSLKYSGAAFYWVSLRQLLTLLHQWWYL